MPSDSLTGTNEKATVAARIAASAPIGTAAIAEAVKNADPKVVESWILEGDQRFKLDAQTLVAMADAGIPGNVTDAMIAASNPGAFQVARADNIRNDDVRGNRVYGGVMTPSSCDPYSRYYDPYECRYSGDYAYRSRYGYGYGSGYGYGYGNGYSNGGFYYPPVVIISGSPSAEANAKAVKGHGYTQSGSGRSGTASTRDNNSAPAAKPNNSTNTGSASSSNTGSSSSSSNTTNTNTSTSDRTAHARP
jgi:hypothetical protein